MITKMKIELHKKYLSGLLAYTDLHAGGNFSCIIYQKCLVFYEDEKVILTQHVIDPFKPMDEIDVTLIENRTSIGSYSINTRGYLVCKFVNSFLSFTGLPTEKDPSIIAFYVYDSRLGSTWSEVYKAELIA